MSVLSEITGRLPNLLETIQGTWAVEYRIMTDRSKEVPQNWLGNVANLATTASDTLVACGEIYGLFPQTWKQLDFTSFIEMNEVDDTTITKCPTERGGFRSVNKVRQPKTVKVTIAKSGIGFGITDSINEIKKLLPKARYEIQKRQEQNIWQAVASAWESGVNSVKSAFGMGTEESPKAKLISVPMEFRVVTPFEVIEHLNLIKLDYTFKQDSGRNMLIMYLTLQEIMEKNSYNSTANKKPKNPTDSKKENVGTVFAQSSSNNDFITKSLGL